jgi:hypothetical protein
VKAGGKKRSVFFSETSVNFKWNVWHYIPEDSNFQGVPIFRAEK